MISKEKIKPRAAIHCKVKLLAAKSCMLARLPKSESAKLPSRGLTLIEGSCNKIPFKVVLEPDGRGSHWFKIDPALSKLLNAFAGDTVELIAESSKNWPEEIVPADFIEHLSKSPQASKLWQEITPLARWDWIRWISGARKTEARARRILIACEKLIKGERRPCCFNRTLCYDAELSKNGVLLNADENGKICT